MERLPTVGIVVPALSDGGGVPSVARFLRNIASASRRYSLTFVSIATAADDATSVRFAKPTSWFRGPTTVTRSWEGIPCVHVGAIGAEAEFLRYQPRRALADALSACNLIQVVAGSAAWANAVCGLGKPVSLQVATRARIERRRRDSDRRGLVGRWRRRMTDITDRLDAKALQRVDAILVENAWMLEYCRALNERRAVDIRYAPPGVDTSLFCPLDSRGLDRDPYILCVGRLGDPRKRIDLLLEAYAAIPENIKRGVTLVLAGSSGPPPAFWRRADKLRLRERIAHVPSPDTSTLVSLYQRAAAFALPSDEEGLGIVLLEAMACGVPCVSTRSGGPDGVITDGRDGYLVPLNDSASMGDRLARLLERRELNIALGEEARRTVETRYAQEIAGEAFLEVWDRLLSHTPSR